MSIWDRIIAVNNAFWHFLGTPFRAIVAMDGVMVRSLVTVGFLAGMIALSAENWAITFYLDREIMQAGAYDEAQRAFMSFLTERMRNTSMLQGLITLVLGAVVLNADRLRFKAGSVEASIGKSEPSARPAPVSRCDEPLDDGDEHDERNR